MTPHLLKNKPFRLLALRQQYNLLYGKNNQTQYEFTSSFHKSALFDGYLTTNINNNNNNYFATIRKNKSLLLVNSDGSKAINSNNSCAAISLLRKSFIYTAASDRNISSGSTTTTTSHDITTNNINDNSLARIEFVNGIIKLILYLPAKQEKCEFTLRIYSDNVGSLVESIKNEDKSIEKAHIYSLDGTRIAQNTPLSQLVTQSFKIRLNDTFFLIEPPPSLAKGETTSNSGIDLQTSKDIEELRQLISKLYLHLNIDEQQRERELEVTRQLEALRNELVPMEKVKEELAAKAKKHTNRMIWFGLGLMSVQAGIMARLTWFDYSWDIVEPISYFVSYSAVIGVYAYYVLTRKEYDYESASDRIFLRHFHKNAIRKNLNVKRYNELKDTIYSLESDLKRIKDSQINSSTKSN